IPGHPPDQFVATGRIPLLPAALCEHCERSMLCGPGIAPTGVVPARFYQEMRPVSQIVDRNDRFDLSHIPVAVGRILGVLSKELRPPVVALLEPDIPDSFWVTASENPA